MLDKRNVHKTYVTNNMSVFSMDNVVLHVSVNETVFLFTACHYTANNVIVKVEHKVQ